VLDPVYQLCVVRLHTDSGDVLINLQLTFFTALETLLDAIAKLAITGIFFTADRLWFSSAMGCGLFAACLDQLLHYI
jgi:hypothetical protein